MTAVEKKTIIQALIRLFAQLDIQTDKDRELISKLYTLLKRMQDE